MNKIELLCPACPSKIKQRVGDIVNTDQTSLVQISTKPLKRAKYNVPYKVDTTRERDCLKC